MNCFDMIMDCTVVAQIASRVEFAPFAHSIAADRK